MSDFGDLPKEITSARTEVMSRETFDKLAFESSRTRSPIEGKQPPQIVGREFLETQTVKPIARRRRYSGNRESINVLAQHSLMVQYQKKTSWL